MRLVADELRYAFKSLRRSPGFALAVIAILGVGIGTNLAVFTVVNSLLLRPLPYPSAEKLVALTYETKEARVTGSFVPAALLPEWRARSATLAPIEFFTVGEVLVINSSWHRINASRASISSGFLTLLGTVNVAQGRTFTAADYGLGAPAVVILGHQFWNQHFGSNPSIVGSSIRLNGQLRQVIGILPAQFRFPGLQNPDVLTPLSIPPDSSALWFVQAIGRMKDTSVAAAATEIAQITAASKIWERLSVDTQSLREGRATVVPLRQYLVGDLRRELAVSIGAAAIVLLVTCLNVVSLWMARVAARRREWSTLNALGATPGRAFANQLIECALLTAAATAVVTFALASTLGYLRSLLGQSTPHSQDISIDSTSIWFAALLAFVVMVLCASISTWQRGARVTLRSTQPSGRFLSSRFRVHIRHVLITLQVAGSMVLLVVGLLLTGTLARLTGSSLGFETERVLTFKLPAAGLPSAHATRDRLLDEMIAGFETIPGVSHAGATTALPLAGHSFRFTLAIEGEPAPSQDPL